MKRFLVAAIALGYSSFVFAQSGPGALPSPWTLNGPGISYSNGGITAPISVPGGDQGIGTINVGGGYYIGGVSIFDGPSFTGTIVTAGVTGLDGVSSCTGPASTLQWQAGQGFQCGVVTAAASSIAVGTTDVTGGTSGRVLYNNSGSLGELATSGTGGVALTNSPALVTPNLGTPSAIDLSNATGLPIGGIAGLGANVASALAIDVGTDGAFVTHGGALGKPSSADLTYATNLPVSSGLYGLGGGVATALGANVGSAGAFVVYGGAGGQPSAIDLANATGCSLVSCVSGTLQSSQFPTLGAGTIFGNPGASTATGQGFTISGLPAATTLDPNDTKVMVQTNGGAYQAAQISQLASSGVAGVQSFNGRTGVVVPATGDYTADQVGAAANDLSNITSQDAALTSLGIIDRVIDQGAIPQTQNFDVPLPTGYDEIQIDLFGFGSTTTGSGLNVFVSTDGTTFPTSGYSYTGNYQSTADTTMHTFSSASAANIAAGLTLPVGGMSMMRVRVLRPGDTTTKKMIVVKTDQQDLNGLPALINTTAAYQSNAALQKVRFAFNAGAAFASGGSYTVRGVKKQ